MKLIFDAHLDLSLNAIDYNRDLRQDLDAIREEEAGTDDRGGRGNGTVCFPEMRRGGIGMCVATLLAGCMKPGAVASGWNSPEIAWAQTQAQLSWYRAMEELGELDFPRPLDRVALGAGMGVVAALILFLITAASMYARMLGLAGLPNELQTILAANEFSFFWIMVLLVVLMLFLGTILDTASIILIGHNPGLEDLIFDLVPDDEPDHGLPVLGPRHRVPMRGRHVLHPLDPDRVVDVAHHIDVLGSGREAPGKAQDYSALPFCHRMKATSSAISRIDSKRPDLPPWPAPILVLSSSVLSSVLYSRNLATHLAGSQ